MPNLFIVTGPTCTGKTAAVNKLLDLHDSAHVICFDSCQIYDHLAIGTGRSDALHPHRSHLYGYCDPKDGELPIKEYINHLFQKYEEIVSNGGIPFLEGGSRKYMSALNDLEKQGKVKLNIVGLKPPHEDYINERFIKRTHGFVEEGILEEIQKALGNGLENNFLLNNYEVYEPFLNHLNNKHTLEDAKKLVALRMKEMHNHQVDFFKQFPSIDWLTVTAKDCLDKIVEMFKHYMSKLFKTNQYAI